MQGHFDQALDGPSDCAQVSTASDRTWSAVGAMAMCVAMLIASEFMPVSLLTPIAADLRTTEGMAGQAISISGLFAVGTSLVIPTVAGRLDRRSVLLGLTALMGISLGLVAMAQSFATLMVSRAALGMVVGGFWSLSTSTVIRLVPPGSVPRALGWVYTGNAVASALSAPIGSYLGGVLGWRGVFWAMVPLVAVTFIWQLRSLPSLPPSASIPIGRIFALFRRRNVRFATVGVMLAFGGTFTGFTYLRPYLEHAAHATPNQLSGLLLTLGVGGFAGTYLAGAKAFSHLYTLLRRFCLAMAIVMLALAAVPPAIPIVAMLLLAWGTISSGIPVCWSTWLIRGIQDEPESGGGLLVAAIQLAIMLGASFGGALLDHRGLTAPFIGGAVFLTAAVVVIGNGARLNALPQNSE